jgi:hypothetical protein
MSDWNVYTLQKWTIGREVEKFQRTRADIDRGVSERKLIADRLARKRADTEVCKVLSLRVDKAMTHITIMRGAGMKGVNPPKTKKSLRSKDQHHMLPSLEKRGHR